MLKSALAGRWMVGLILVLTIWLSAQVGAALAAPDTLSASPELAQGVLATPTPFRFLTPTPFVPGATTTTTRPATAPNAGGFPMELAFPILAGGLAAIGGGSLVLRRKTAR
ncbi:MAG: hypothetical protein JO057_13350 [Chloroflexi bacterium]|nr:hypothetical protein [Chloroflexota bacterium]